MPIREDKLTNKPLSGAEVAQVVMNNAGRILDDARERILSELDGRMRADAVFGAGYGYPRLAMEFSVKIQFANPNVPKPQLTISAGEGKPPLLAIADGSVQVAVAIDRQVTIDSPNLTRLDEGLPFTATSVSRPAPGELLGTISTIQIPVAAEDYAHIPRTLPVDTDNSEAFAEQLGITESQRLRPAKDRRSQQ